MAKRTLSVKEVLAKSQEILAKNGNKMEYQVWQDAMTNELGDFSPALVQIVKNKMLKFELSGFSALGTPNFYVVKGD